MERRPGVVKEQRRKSAGLLKAGMQRALPFGLAALACAAVVVLIVIITRPKLLWYVDEDFTAAWNRVLEKTAPPFSRHEIKSLPSGAAPDFPKRRFGYIITRQGPAGEHSAAGRLRLYTDLVSSRQYEGWISIAVDPWMVFRKHQDPEPSRSFLDTENERGSILLPGVDNAAVRAWLSQVLQESPGVFPESDDAWKNARRDIARNYPLQSGALTYSWVMVWPELLRERKAWLYAPLSQARALPPYRMGLLDATRFPEPQNWTKYGLQADILWARQQGSEKQRKKMAAADQWLQSAETQTIIADTIEWIPAHPAGVPYNTISWEAKMAWLSSSFIWQGADDAQDW